MEPKRQAGAKSAPASDGGLDRDDVEYILSTFKEDGKVTPKGTRANILDIYDRMRFGHYESPLDSIGGQDGCDELPPKYCVRCDDPIPPGRGVLCDDCRQLLDDA
jgi:hypothetical protein